MVSQSSSEVNTTFVVEGTEGPRAVQILKNDPFFKEWFVVDHATVGIIAVIGSQIHSAVNKVKIFQALAKIKQDVIAIAQASDGINVSLIVPVEKVRETANAINEEFNI
jgi:aspartokinase